MQRIPRSLQVLGLVAVISAIFSAIFPPPARASTGRSTAAFTPDGEWSSFSAYFYGPTSLASAVYDPLADRLVLFGGVIGATPINKLQALPFAGTLAWSLLPAQGNPPDPRTGGAAVYDASRHRMIYIVASSQFPGLNDVWELDLSSTPRWRRLSPAGTAPAARVYHTLIYDAPRDRVVLFGGQVGGSGANDVWALNLAPVLSWSEISPAGVFPSGRYGHSAIYDPVRQRMIVFGGTTGSGASVNDVWALSLSGVPTWNLVTPSGTEPPAQSYAVAIYDPPRDRMLIHGMGLWALSLGPAPAWSQPVTAGTPPADRSRHAGIYDPVRDRLVFTGGSYSLGGASIATWALSLAGTPTWTELNPRRTQPEPSATSTPSKNIVPDFTHRRYALIELPPSIVGGPAPDGWTVSIDEGVGWRRVPAVNAPSGANHASAFLFNDPTRNRCLAYFPGDTTAWAVALGDTFAWTKLGGATLGPLLNRVGFAAAYEATHDRWLLFGGATSSNTLNDLWVLNLAATPTWTQLSPTGGPPPTRRAGSLVYDPPRDRFLLFGGNFGSGSFPTQLGDLWELSSALQWSQLSPGAGPAARSSASLVYDSVRDRMLLISGNTAFSTFTDIWSLSVSGPASWTQLHPLGSSVAVHGYDPVEDRCFLLGAFGSANDGYTLTALSFSPPAAPDVVCPPYLTSSVPGVNLAYYLVTSHSPPTEDFDFQINSARNWPSFPLTARRSIDGFTSQYLTVGIPVPDSAAGGPNTFTIHVWRRSDPTARDSCSHSFGAPTGVAVSFGGAEREAGRVKLTWLVLDPALTGAAVERRIPGAAWSSLAKIAPDGFGRFVYEDRTVEPGLRYDYRLGFRGDHGVAYSGMVEIEVPGLALEFAGAWPNPSRRIRISFSLPRTGPARAEVFDIAGRRVISRDVGALGPGPHVVEISQGVDLAPGVYEVRLTQGSQSRTARACVLR